MWFFWSCRTCSTWAFSHFLPSKDSFTLRSAVLWHGLATGSLVNPLCTQDLKATCNANSIIHEPQIWLDCGYWTLSRKVRSPRSPQGEPRLSGVQCLTSMVGSLYGQLFPWSSFCFQHLEFLGQSSKVYSPRVNLADRFPLSGYHRAFRL